MRDLDGFAAATRICSGENDRPQLRGINWRAKLAGGDVDAIMPAPKALSDPRHQFARLGLVEIDELIERGVAIPSGIAWRAIICRIRLARHRAELRSVSVFDDDIGERREVASGVHPWWIFRQVASPKFGIVGDLIALANLHLGIEIEAI